MLGDRDQGLRRADERRTVVERCMLMTTDPGDLVLDPTCGSGTTAFVAEQWGRRWITIDTSRVALALARQRLMSSASPYYLLADSDDGRAKEEAICAAATCLTAAVTERHPSRIRLRARAAHHPRSRSRTTPTSCEGCRARRSTRRSAVMRSTSCSTTSPTRTRGRSASPGRSRSRALSPHRSLGFAGSAVGDGGRRERRHRYRAGTRRRRVRAVDHGQPAGGGDPERSPERAPRTRHRGELRRDIHPGGRDTRGG